MTNLRQQMRDAVQAGIDGWLAVCFSGDYVPTDSITEYPLTPDTARIYYHSSMPYSAIEDGFISQMGNVHELNAEQLQAWINYHWQYARVELAEDFSQMPIVPITPDMETRRNDIRLQMAGQGYKLVQP